MKGEGRKRSSAREKDEDGLVFRKKRVIKEAEATPPAVDSATVSTPRAAGGGAEGEEERQRRLLAACAEACHAELERLREVAQMIPSADTKAVLEGAEKCVEEFQKRVNTIVTAGFDPLALSGDDGSLASFQMPSGREGRIHVLRTLLKRFEDEEREWKQVLDRHTAVASDQEARRGHMDAELAAAAQQSAAAAASGAAVGMLEGAFTAAHRKLCFQVDALCAMLSGVEELVERAERACAAVQSEYQQEKFRPFAHIGSPFTLIRALARAPPGKK